MTTTDTTQASAIDVTMDVVEFRRQVGNAVLFCSPDKDRPLLTSVLLEIDAEGQRFVATDSYALIIEPVEAEIPPIPNTNRPASSSFGEFLLPSDLLKTFVKTVGPKATGDVTITLTPPIGAFPGEVVLRHESGLSMSGTRVEGEFPRYKNLMPAGYKDWAREVDTFGELFSLDTFMLARIAKVIGNATSSSMVRKHRADFFAQSRHKPIVVEIGTAIILQMPVKH